ncbi:hypothetical protein PMAYCL1PPCAC_27834, partial [Pristionchus mayeri]
TTVTSEQSLVTHPPQSADITTCSTGSHLRTEDPAQPEAATQALTTHPPLPPSPSHSSMRSPYNAPPVPFDPVALTSAQRHEVPTEPPHSSAYVPAHSLEVSVDSFHTSSHHPPITGPLAAGSKEPIPGNHIITPHSFAHHREVSDESFHSLSPTSAHPHKVSHEPYHLPADVPMHVHEMCKQAHLRCRQRLTSLSRCTSSSACKKELAHNRRIALHAKPITSSDLSLGTRALPRFSPSPGFQ